MLFVFPYTKKSSDKRQPANPFELSLCCLLPLSKRKQSRRTFSSQFLHLKLLRTLLVGFQRLRKIRRRVCYFRLEGTRGLVLADQHNNKRVQGYIDFSLGKIHGRGHERSLFAKKRNDCEFNDTRLPLLGHRGYGQRRRLSESLFARFRCIPSA